MKLWFLLLFMMLMFALPGCVTTSKASKPTKTAQLKQLQTEASRLSSQVQQKDAQIASLKTQFKAARSNPPRLDSPKNSPPQTSSSPATVKMTHKNIQLALKNAGYYSGAIDGKFGKQTKRAIRDFQKANGLAADGMVGRSTWAKLRNYSRQRRSSAGAYQK